MSSIATDTPIGLVFASALSGLSRSAAGIGTFNQRGITATGGATTSSGRLGIVADTVALSREAQALLAQRSTDGGFTARSGAVQQLVNGAGAGSEFVDADLNGVFFVGQDLTGAVFQNSVLSDANFSGADLRNAAFIDSLVSGAQFNQADIRGANFTGADGLSFGQVSGAFFDTSTRFPSDIGTQIFGTFQPEG